MAAGVLIVAIGKHSSGAAFVATGAAGSAMSAAFFGYVLKILVGIFEQTWEARFGPDDD
jgi:hypothetical protein